MLPIKSLTFQEKSLQKFKLNGLKIYKVSKNNSKFINIYLASASSKDTN